MTLNPEDFKLKLNKKHLMDFITIIVLTAIGTLAMSIAAMIFFTTEQMQIINPVLVAIAVFIAFSLLLSRRVKTNLFGEIGFIYLLLILVYTVAPALTFLAMKAAGLGITVIFLTPELSELGIHFWRHVLFMSAVAVGYLAFRGGEPVVKSINEINEQKSKSVIVIMIIIILCCVIVVTLLSSSPTDYTEHYARFDHLSPFLRRLANLFLTFKDGGYFILMVFMFNHYRRYKTLIFLLVPILCVYEIVYSFGSRIEAFIILLACIGLYHYKVAPIKMRKAVILMLALASLFSAVEIYRSFNYSVEDAQYAVMKEGFIQVSEIMALYETGFHLYTEREQGNLPPRPWPMLFNSILSLIPFIDHSENHPMYWYARHYFPEASVPPKTMGVIADSAMWGGEMDLLMRSLVNGAIFALLLRWFLRRREKWWALTIYIYCYATCILTMKYAVFYQLTPLVRIILPILLLTSFLFLLQNRLLRSRLITAKLIR